MEAQSVRTSNRITSILFSIYLIALVWILLFKLGVHFNYGNHRRYNLIPFREYVLYNGSIDKLGTILNILVFIPLGIYISILQKRLSIFGKVLICMLISLLIESLQYVMAIGALDITDVITNTTGGIIGIIIYAILVKILSNSFTAQKVVNILAAIGTIGMIILLFMLKMNMLPLRYQ